VPRERVCARVAAAADHRAHLVVDVRQPLQQRLDLGGLGLRQLGLRRARWGGPSRVMSGMGSDSAVERRQREATRAPSPPRRRARRPPPPPPRAAAPRPPGRARCRAGRGARGSWPRTLRTAWSAPAASPPARPLTGGPSSWERAGMRGVCVCGGGCARASLAAAAGAAGAGRARAAGPHAAQRGAAMVRRGAALQRRTSRRRSSHARSLPLGMRAMLPTGELPGGRGGGVGHRRRGRGVGSRRGAAQRSAAQHQRRATGARAHAAAVRPRRHG
jgi:hypothetical protein